MSINVERDRRLGADHGRGLKVLGDWQANSRMEYRIRDWFEAQPWSTFDDMPAEFREYSLAVEAIP